MSAAPGADLAERLRLTEIFHSIQGEADHVGWPTVFIRLTGCPLRCVWCDTTYSFHGGQWWSLAEIIAEVRKHAVRHVCVTGGEPLAQRRVHRLMADLCDLGYSVSLETSGALDIADVDRRVHRIIDLKAPGSGELKRNLLSNLAALRPGDQIKFVLKDRVDFDWAVAMVDAEGLAAKATILCSPVSGALAPAELAQWILESGRPLRLQLQLHKLLWGDQPGR